MKGFWSPSFSLENTVKGFWPPSFSLENTVKGLKRKIPIAKIEKKDSRAVTSSEPSKASAPCLLSDSQISIVATPLSSDSNASFYSFDHSSVDSLAFLADQHPLPEDLGLGFLCEDEWLAKSEDPEELRDALDAMKKMLQDLGMTVDKQGDREDDVKENKKKKNGLHGAHPKQTLKKLQPSSSSASLCNQKQFSDSEDVKGEEFMVRTDFYEKNLHLPDNQFLAISDNQELDLDEMIDFDTNCESLLMNLENMDGDFTEILSELTSIATL